VRAHNHITDSEVNHAILMMLQGQVPEELLDLVQRQLCGGGRARLCHPEAHQREAHKRAAFVRAYSPQASLRAIARVAGVNVTTVRRWVKEEKFQRDVDRIAAFFKRHGLDRSTGRFACGGHFSLTGKSDPMSPDPTDFEEGPEVILPPLEKMTREDLDWILGEVSADIW
jgi:hypothetical protein